MSTTPLPPPPPRTPRPSTPAALATVPTPARGCTNGRSWSRSSPHRAQPLVVARVAAAAAARVHRGPRRVPTHSPQSSGQRQERCRFFPSQASAPRSPPPGPFPRRRWTADRDGGKLEERGGGASGGVRVTAASVTCRPEWPSATLPHRPQCGHHRLRRVTASGGGGWKGATSDCVPKDDTRGLVRPAWDWQQDASSWVRREGTPPCSRVGHDGCGCNPSSQLSPDLVARRRGGATKLNARSNSLGSCAGIQELKFGALNLD